MTVSRRRDHVDQQPKVTKKIGTYDGVPNVCKDKNPTKCSAESQVEGKGLSAKGCDGGSIECL